MVPSRRPESLDPPTPAIAAGYRWVRYAALANMIATPIVALLMVGVVFITLAWISQISSRISVEQPNLYRRLGGHPLSPEFGVISTQFRWLRLFVSGAYKAEVEDPGIRRSIRRFVVWYVITNVPLIVFILVLVAAILLSAGRAA